MRRLPKIAGIRVDVHTRGSAHEEDLSRNQRHFMDTAVAIVRYRDGSLGQFLGATSMYPGSLRRIQLAGRNGTAEVLEDELVTWAFRDEAADDEEIRARFGQARETSGGAADPMDIDYTNHRRIIESFLSSLSSGEPYALDAREARKAVAIIEAIYTSAVQGGPVTVD